MELAQANLEAFAATLLELAREDSDLLVVTSDSRGSAKLAPFAKAAPGQIVEVGIAEQNLVGVSAGLAAAGKNVFAVSPACFLTARSLEQIKNDLCYSDRPVTAVGITPGQSASQPPSHAAKIPAIQTRGAHPLHFEKLPPSPLESLPPLALLTPSGRSPPRPPTRPAPPSPLPPPAPPTTSPLLTLSS